MSWGIDCKDVMGWCETYTGPKFHAMLCDPPYELGFMGKDWDKSGIAFDPEVWVALKEHLFPGAFIFVFGSSRGWHRLAVAIEDAGFVFHPSLMVWGWVRGQGFCKATRVNRNGSGHEEWEGHRYGRQALRPLVEMIICAQKPYEGKPVDCITETGAGTLWIDGSRMNSGKGRWPPNFCLIHTPDCQKVGTKEVKGSSRHGEHIVVDAKSSSMNDSKDIRVSGYSDKDGLETIDNWECVEECAAHRLGEQSGISKSNGDRDGDIAQSKARDWAMQSEAGVAHIDYNDIGTTARFFPQFDWNAEVTERLMNSDQVNYCSKASGGERTAGIESNVHPTIKPIALARWLATLLLPPLEYEPRRILIPFAGVMSEVIGAKLAGWEEIVGIEMEEEYCEIGEARMKFWSQFESREDGLKAAKQVKKQRKQKEQIERLDHKVLSLW